MKKILLSILVAFNLIGCGRIILSSDLDGLIGKPITYVKSAPRDIRNSISGNKVYTFVSPRDACEIFFETNKKGVILDNGYSGRGCSSFFNHSLEKD